MKSISNLFPLLKTQTKSKTSLAPEMKLSSIKSKFSSSLLNESAKNKIKGGVVVSDVVAF